WEPFFPPGEIATSRVTRSVIMSDAARPRVILMGDAALYEVIRPKVAALPFPLNCPRTVVCDLQAWILNCRAKLSGPLVAPHNLLHNVVHGGGEMSLLLVRFAN